MRTTKSLKPLKTVPLCSEKKVVFSFATKRPARRVQGPLHLRAGRAHPRRHRRGGQRRRARRNFLCPKVLSVLIYRESCMRSCMRGGVIRFLSFGRWAAARRSATTRPRPSRGRLRRGPSAIAPPQSPLNGESLQLQAMSVTNNSAPSYTHTASRSGPRRAPTPASAPSPRWPSGRRAARCGWIHDVAPRC